jgi:hypothetical protein
VSFQKELFFLKRAFCLDIQIKAYLGIFKRKISHFGGRTGGRRTGQAEDRW